jgi:hypothetical protein
MDRPHHAAVDLLAVAVLALGLGAIALSTLLPVERCAPAWLGGGCASNGDLKTAIAIVGTLVVVADALFFAITRHLDDDPTAD